MERDTFKTLIGAIAILLGIWLIIKILPAIIVFAGSIISLAFSLLILVAIAYGIYYILKKF